MAKTRKQDKDRKDESSSGEKLVSCVSVVIGGIVALLSIVHVIPFIIGVLLFYFGYKGLKK